MNIRITTILTFVILVSFQNSYSQSLVGPDTVCQGESVVFRYTGTPGVTHLWSSVLGFPHQTLSDSALVTFVNHGTSGQVQVTVLDSANNTIANVQKNVVVIEPPNPHITSEFEASCQSQVFETIQFDTVFCKVVCDSSIVLYETAFNSGNTYTWEVFGSLSDTADENELVVVWDTVPGFGLVRVTETDEYGCSAIHEICIEIVKSPTIDTSLNSSLSLCTSEKLDIAKLIRTTGATKYFWDFGDGNTSIEKDPTYEYESTGTFNLRFIVENECGCQDSLNVEVNVSDGPSPDVYCISTVCQGEQHVYSIPADSSGNYYWNNISGLLNPVVAGQNSASATIEWQACDINGYGILNVYKSSVPTCDQNEYVPIITSIGSYIEGPEIVCANTQHIYTMPPVPGSKFHWKVTGGTFAFNGGTSLYGQDLRHVAIDWDSITPGHITVDFFNHTLGCGDSLSLDIDILKPFSVTGTKKGCENTQYTYTAANGGAGSFEWEVYKYGVGVVEPQAAGITAYNYTFNSGGEYEIRAYETTGIYCNSVYRHRVIISDVASAPPIPIGDTLTCMDEYKSYHTQPYSNDYFLEWEIDGGSPSVSNNNLVTINWNTAGPDYNIKVFNVSKEFPYCRSDSVEVHVHKLDTSHYNFTFTRDAEVCANSITYHGVTTNVENLEYDYAEWALLPGNIGSILSGQGTRNISIQWTNASTAQYMSFAGVICSDTVRDTILQHSFLNDNITIFGGGSGCPGDSVSFGQNTTQWQHVTQKKWYWGDGSTTTVPTTYYTPVKHSYSQPGFYQVRLEVTYGGYCPETKVSNILNVLINELPQANLSTDSSPTYCPADDSTEVSIFLTGQGLNTTGNFSYEWYRNGSGGFSPTNSPFQHTVTEATPSTMGNYKVEVTDDSTGCVMFTNIITIDTCDNGQGGSGDTSCQPGNVEIDFSYSLDTADCGKVTFTPLPSGSHLDTILSYNYTYGDGNQNSSGVNTYDEAGFYQVSLEMGFIKTNNDTCVVQVSKAVKVPVFADFDYYLTCDTGSNMILKIINLSGWVVDPITSTIWTPSATGNNPSYSLTAGGHNVTMKVISSAGMCKVTKNITVPQPALADFTIQTGPYCEQTPITFTENSSGSIYRWYWDHGDGTSALLINTTRAYDNQSISTLPYFPKLIVYDEYGCVDSTSKQIIVHDNGLGNSEIFITGSVPFCFGDSIELSTINKGTSSPFDHLWTTSETSASIYVKNTGKYNVRITDAFNCVFRPYPVNVGVNYTPVAIPRGITEYCPGDLVEFDMFTGSTYEYYWEKNSIFAGDSSYLQYTAGSGPGTDYINAIIIDTNSNCSDTTEVVVNIRQTPVINSITASPNNCEVSMPTLTASVSGVGLKYNWSNGEITNPITVNSSGLYELTLTNSAGCDTSAEIQIYPRPDFSTIMTGCYDFCLNDTPQVIIQGLNPHYYTHEWLDIAGGSPSVYSTADTLLLTSPGHYLFRLAATNINSAGCTDTSDTLEIDLWPCNECSGITSSISFYEINCFERDSAFRWTYDFEILINDIYPGTITISPEYGQVSSVNKNLLTNQPDYVAGKFSEFSATTDSICLNIETITAAYGKCQVRICDTLPTCHMPCKIDSIFIDSIRCLGLDENNRYLYYFESRIYNAENDYQFLHASIDSGSITGLSLDSLAPGMNALNGFIHSIDSGYQCILWGFYLTSSGGEDPECCEQEYCLELPSCVMPDTCDSIGITEEGWEIECVGTDINGNFVYQFEVYLNNSGSVYSYQFGSNNGSFFGVTPNYFVNGTNTFSGLYSNTGGSDSICISFIFIDTTTNDICYFKVCGEIPEDEGEGCEEAMPCDIAPENLQIYCRGTNGDGEPYYEFTLGINNPGIFVGPVYSTSPNMWINSPSTLPSGMSVLKGGFIPYGHPSVCYEIFIYDSGSQTYCQQELCFDNFPSCCEEISERKAFTEQEFENDIIIVSKSDLKVFPNPTNSIVNVSYKIEDDSKGSISISNVLSNRLAEFSSLEGTGNIQLNTTLYKEGVYIVVLQVNGNIEKTTKLIVLHK